jgi:hypothetical protein
MKNIRIIRVPAEIRTEHHQTRVYSDTAIPPCSLNVYVSLVSRISHTNAAGELMPHSLFKAVPCKAVQLMSDCETLRLIHERILNRCASTIPEEVHFKLRNVNFAAKIIFTVTPYVLPFSYPVCRLKHMALKND